ncbi:sugar phosphate isomerase/epimerase family protein [Paenibacillus allorhizosphaerae]|uniref:Inosose dehydratase n=1 Tax=Paenibacillus allorhizosphaerae TaxID=2849866 RepID=A0ABN7TP70_9BACL|nr:sugar phosphate isomerase/epimerase family protein [Paenibacillus allorhizosphaerae]CAG7644555.1 Inosose dehydratase [Paenibacillus allorhizosphaerae]
MDLALSMWSVHRTAKEKGWRAIDFLQFCEAEGYRKVELLAHFWQDAARELEETAACAEQCGITVVSYAVSNNFVSPDPEARRKSLLQITEAFPVALSLGTRTIRVFAGNLLDGIEYGDAWQWIVDGLGAAAKEAEAAGMSLCLENHGKLAGKGEQVRHIIEAVGSPALKSTLDVGNFLLVDEDPVHATRSLLPYIGHVHVKDFKKSDGGRYKSLQNVTFDGVPAGNGDVDIPAILGLLKQFGYGGSYVLEYEGQGIEADGIRESYRNMNLL